MKIRGVLVFLIFVLACSLSAKADKPGTVRGIVDGPGSTLLADAEISLTNKAGGDPLVTSSDEEGEFLFENVPPGDYVLLVKSPGFQDAQQLIRGNTAGNRGNRGNRSPQSNYPANGNNYPGNGNSYPSSPNARVELPSSRYRTASGASISG